MTTNNEKPDRSKKNNDDKTYIRFKDIKGFYNNITENVGSYSPTNENINDVYFGCEIKSAITEYDFYKCFLYLKAGLSKAAYKDNIADEALTAVNIEYLAAIMVKPLTFSMPARSKNSVQIKLAAQLGKTPKSAYSAIHRLRSKGYLVKTEDNIIMPGPELQRLRVITKKHLKDLGCFPVSYLLNFIVTGDVESDLTRDIIDDSYVEFD